jgi:hypothetical protein
MITITSEVEGFKGTITLVDHPTLPAVAAWWDASIEVNTYRAKITAKKGVINRMHSHELRFDAAMAFCESWEIEGQPTNPTLKTFKVKKSFAADTFLNWFFDQVIKFIEGELEIPKDLEPASTPTPSPEDTSQPS